MSSTNTAMPTPTCENCGRDKTPTYICDACCDKLNTITRKRATDYAKLEAENVELRDRHNNRITQDIKDWSLITELRSMLDVAYGQSLTKALEAKLADLAAANATLDRLRELLPEGGVWCYACNRATVPIWGEEPYEHIDPKYKQMKTTFRCSICKRDTHAKDSCVDTLRTILYPTPENDND